MAKWHGRDGSRPITGAGITRCLRLLAMGRPAPAPGDLVVSPTYVPDLVEATLDLLIDGVLTNDRINAPAALRARLSWGAIFGGTVAKAVKGEKITVLLDLIGERLAFERSGVRLYDAMLAKACSRS